MTPKQNDPQQRINWTNGVGGLRGATRATDLVAVCLFVSLCLSVSRFVSRPRTVCRKRAAPTAQSSRSASSILPTTASRALEHQASRATKKSEEGRSLRLSLNVCMCLSRICIPPKRDILSGRGWMARTLGVPWGLHGSQGAKNIDFGP